MNADAWFTVVLVVLTGIGVACAFLYRKAHRHGWLRGYQAGMRVVHRDAQRLANQVRAAERNIDYLYEGARREIRRQSYDSAPPDRGR